MTRLRKSIEETQAAFRRAFGYTPTHALPVPGRMVLLGATADWTQGLLTAAAIDRYLVVVGAPRTDGKISVARASSGDRQTFSRSNLELLPADHWINPVKTLLNQLRQEGRLFPGFDSALGGDLRSGVGVASASALLVGLALFIYRLAPFALGASSSAARPRPGKRDQPPLLTHQQSAEMARICHRAEQALRGGAAPESAPLACLAGKAAHGLEIDVQSLSVQPCPLYGEVAWLACDTGIRDDTAGPALEGFREACAQTAVLLGLPSLRRLDLKLLEQRRSKLSPHQHDCAHHVVAENQRVIFANRALHQGDLEQFGHYLYQSHQSSRRLFQIPEVDLLVDLARTHPGSLGARQLGWSGATLHLIRTSALPNYAEAIATRYRERLGSEPAIEELRIVDGAAV